MSDPLTALMYAVQVMNFLKTLIVKTLRQREDSAVECGPVMQPEPSDDDRHHTKTKPTDKGQCEIHEEEEEGKQSGDGNDGIDNDGKGHFGDMLSSNSSMRHVLEGGNRSFGSGRNQSRIPRSNSGQPRSWNQMKKELKKESSQSEIYELGERNKEVSVMRRVNSCTEAREAWR